MNRSAYREHDSSFGKVLLTLRTRMGLTQVELAVRLGVSRRAVAEWEAGNSYPTAEHLKTFLVLCVQASTFSAGHEAEQIRTLWKAAHQKVLLDEDWAHGLLVTQSQPTVKPPKLVGEVHPEKRTSAQPALRSRVDWGDALDVPSFYGREREASTLAQWIEQERGRVVSVLGMGGIGKSALVTSAMRQLASHFQVVLFRSLRDTPSCEALLEDCLHVLAPEQLEVDTADLEARLSLLLECLRQQRVLLVLDNLESVLQAGEALGHFRAGYEDYAALLERVAQQAHQSCLLLTSREKPAALRALEGRHTQMRSLRLSGLSPASCEQLLTIHELLGSPQEHTRLVERYEGNPLALHIVAETITEHFGGQVAAFLAQDTLVFGSIKDLLDEQWGRLSVLERTLLYWLAILREPVSLQELQAALVAPLVPVQVLEAVDALQRRSLVERGQRPGSFTLQSVVLEYVTTHLVEQLADEIVHGRLLLLHELSLSQAQAKDYVRQTQERLLVAPLLARLQSTAPGHLELEQRLRSLLSEVRGWAESRQGYAPANLVSFLRVLRGHLRGLDLSRLVLRGVHLQGVELQDANLSGALLQECVFTETFDAPGAVAISLSGQYWATASSRGEVRVWREAGKILHLAWQAHTDHTWALAFSPDERLLASGSFDGSLKLWDVESGALLWSGWHPGVICLAFAPDGSLLASEGRDATFRLWDPRLGTLLQEVPHPDPVLALAWSPNGNRLAMGSFDGQIRLWEVGPSRPATCLQTLEGHTHWVSGLAFAPDGRRLASASYDGTVKLWEVGRQEEGSHRVCQTLTGHTQPVIRVVWSPDGATLASGGFDHAIRLWDAKLGTSRGALQGHSSVLYSLAFSPDSHHLLSGSDDGTLRIWDVERGEALRVIQGYAAALYDVAWSPDGAQLASVGADSWVCIWEVTERGGRMPRSVLGGHEWGAYGVGWRPDGRLLASCGWDATIRFWEPDTGTCVQVSRDPDGSANFSGLAWSPDGKFLASGTTLQGVYVWEMTTRSIRWAGHQPSTGVRRVAWSMDGRCLVGGGHDGYIYVWEASDGRLLQRLAGHQGAVMSVAFSPDGTQLASGGGSRDNGELFVWDAQSWQRVQALVEQRVVISAVAFSPDGTRLISGGSDGRLRWWDVQNGECVLVREAHQGTVYALKMSSDGSRLASCGDDGAINVWELESGEHLRTLRRDRPYERLSITGIRGLTEAQKATLRALGAVEDPAATSSRHVP